MKLLITLFFLISCSQTPFLATKELEFSKAPQRIFFFQIAGFDLHHTGLLKFTDWERMGNIEFEDFQCHGDIWNYDLFSLRPKSYQSFDSQVSGSLVDWNNCQSYVENKPFWKVLEEKEFSTMIIEDGGSKKESLLNSKVCQKTSLQSTWVDNSLFIKRELGDFKDFSFSPYYVTNKSYVQNGFYQDSSCGGKKCFQSLEKLVSSALERWSGRQRKFTLVYRDFSYAKLIEQRDFKGVARKLKEISETISFLKQKFGTSENLFLVSSSTPRSLDYPYQGKSWKNLENSIRSLKTNMMSKVLATGARSENFCGTYNNVDVFKRLFWGKKKYQFL